MGRTSKAERRRMAEAGPDQQQNPETDMESSSQPCAHLAPGSQYLKQRLGPQKRLLHGKDDYPTCELCFIYGLWKTYGQQNLVKYRPKLENVSAGPANNEERFRIDPNSLEQGLNTEISGSSETPVEAPVLLKHTSTFPLVEESFKMDLGAGQFGEAYHVLICEILRIRVSETGFRFCVDFPDLQQSISWNERAGEKDSVEQIWDLFKWCDAVYVFGLDKSSRSTSKGKATRMIAAAFRAANNPDEPGLTQSELFEYIRESLGQPRLQGLKSVQGAIKGDATYLSSAYAAKYWLNRYFRLTQQFGPVEKTEHKFDRLVCRRGSESDVGPELRCNESHDPRGPLKSMFEDAAICWMSRRKRSIHVQTNFDNEQERKGARKTDKKSAQVNLEGHIYNGMPKSKDTGIVAIVHIRRTLNTGSLNGRGMDDNNLKHVLISLQGANKLCVSTNDRNWSTQRFSHVILYGDFDHAEGLKLQDEAIDTLDNDLQRSALKLQAHAMAIQDRQVGTHGYEAAGAMPDKKYNKELETHRDLKNAWEDRPDERKIHVSFICRPWNVKAVAAESGTNGKDCGDQKPAGKDIKSTDKKKGTKGAEQPKGTDGNAKKNTVSKRSTALKVVSLATSKLWQDFRSDDSDRLPMQVKILGIWTALRDRYGEDLCVIGHRSGFVEGAGLMGIPVFYLNNERTDLGLSREEQSRMLYDGKVYCKILRLAVSDQTSAKLPPKSDPPAQDHDVPGMKQANERRQSEIESGTELKQNSEEEQSETEPGAALKQTSEETQKRIEMKTELKQASKKTQPEGESETELKKKLKRLRELSDVMNTFIPIKALEKKKVKDLKPGEAFQVEGEDESKELKAALFTYMCCRLKSGLPAWTQRVVMMHEEDDEWEKAVKELKKEDSSYGVKWLRNRVWAARNQVRSNIR